MQELPPLGESGSELFHFIPEPINFAEMTKFKWHKYTLAKSNSEGDKEFIQQSDFSRWRSIDIWACDSMNGCLQS